MHAKQLIKLCFITITICLLNCSKAKSYKNEVPLTNVDINNSFESLNEQTHLQEKLTNTLKVIPKDLKIIKSGQVKYKVENVRTVTRQIKKLAQQYRAYISDLRFENNLYKKENRFTIKVPNENFDIVLDSMRSFTQFIDFENITTKDVTEEYLDIETRLKTKKEIKNRYESILRENAITIEDILAVEEKLKDIQEEIESSEGRLKFLTHKVAYSTIQIDLYETVNYTEEPISYSKTFWEKSKEGLSFGWQFFESAFIGVFYIWPFLILAVIILIIYKKNRKV